MTADLLPEDLEPLDGVLSVEVISNFPTVWRIECVSEDTANCGHRVAEVPQRMLWGSPQEAEFLAR